jgi:flagellar biosynthetic protein FliS
MDERLRQFYVESRIKNSSSGELLLMLWESLVESAELAEAQIGAPAGSPERTMATQSIAHCINIITELSTALHHDIDPPLCATLSSLYAYFAREFSGALRTGDPRKIGTILPMLRELKAAWEKAQKLAGQAQLTSGVHLAPA